MQIHLHRQPLRLTPQPTGYSPGIGHKKPQIIALPLIIEAPSTITNQSPTYISPIPSKEESVFSTHTVKRKLQFSPYSIEVPEVKQKAINLKRCKLDKPNVSVHNKSDVNNSFLVYNIQAQRERGQSYKYVPQHSEYENILHKQTQKGRIKIKNKKLGVSKKSLNPYNRSETAINKSNYGNMIISRMMILRHIR